MPDRTTKPWAGVAAGQAGVVTRRQLLDVGLTTSAVSWLVRDWPQPYRGVYLTFTGPQPWLTRAWAGLLACGSGAVVAGEGALYLHGINDDPPSGLHFAVPHDRHPDVGPVRVDRRRHLQAMSLPSAAPPRLRVEAATLDVAGETTSSSRAIAVVLSAVQRRRTTAKRLLEHLEQRSRQPWRDAITDALADAAAGVHSLLERRFVTKVVRPHGLPPLDHNLAETECDVWGRSRGRRYRDIRMRGFGLVIELDGEGTHPWSSRPDERRRDNRLLAHGDLTLRYGWSDVHGRACESAAEIGTVLRRLEWTGSLRRCGPTCPIGTVSLANHG